MKQALKSQPALLGPLTSCVEKQEVEDKHTTNTVPTVKLKTILSSALVKHTKRLKKE